MRTGALLGIQGTAAFGAASLALLRFTHGIAGAAAAIAVSLTVWTVVPAMLAVRRVIRSDIQRPRSDRRQPARSIVSSILNRDGALTACD